MATEIDLTNGMIRVMGVSVQPLASAIDVSDFDQADLILFVGALQGTFTGNGLTVSVLGGMQKESELGWVTLQSFTGVTVSGSEKKNVAGLPRYIRWSVSGFEGGIAAAFTVRGMLRRN